MTSRYAGTLKTLGKILILSAGAAVMIAAATATGATQSAGVQAAQPVERELIPGAEKMTGAERDTYRRRMEAARTAEERARIREEYVKAAQQRAPAAPLAGDAKRGAALHSACFSCHGIERYVAPITYAAATFMDSVLRASGLSDLPPVEPTRFKGKAKSIADLRAGVARRNEYLSPKMTPQEMEDVVAYLNETYYRFTQ